MAKAPPQDVTQLLLAWSNGDQAALEKLVPLVYEELHRLARRRMAREGAGHPLQATALVNEAYLRLVRSRPVRWESRGHFFSVSARLMRRILVDFARNSRSLKRGSGRVHVSIDDASPVSPLRDADLVALDEALRALAALDSRQSQVVELRFFGGLSIDETAAVLKISPGTVRRDWTLARAWLNRELRRAASNDS